MASANGTQAFCNWHQAWRDVPGDMHGSARTTGTKAKAALGAIGAQGCWNDLLKPIEVPEARRTGCHQDSRNYPLPLTSGSIKFQRSGIRWRWDLDERMASVMATWSEGFGCCVEGIWIDVGLKNAEALFALPCILCGWIRRLGGWKLWLFYG